ncbi:PTS cellobiose transporter subunit IIBC, partial [Staphylococcus sp. HMSC070D07]
QRGFPKESQRTTQVGVAPNKENFDKKFHKHRKIG